MARFVHLVFVIIIFVKTINKKKKTERKPLSFEIHVKTTSKQQHFSNKRNKKKIMYFRSREMCTSKILHVIWTMLGIYEYITGTSGHTHTQGDCDHISFRLLDYWLNILFLYFIFYFFREKWILHWRCPESNWFYSFLCIQTTFLKNRCRAITSFGIIWLLIFYSSPQTQYTY